MKQKIWYIDHYDSFSRNVMNWLTENPHIELQHVFYDSGIMSEVHHSTDPIVLSPGPNHPKDIPQTISLIKSRLGFVPILGICLGHQALAFSEGFEIRASENSFHGTQQLIRQIEKCSLTSQLPEKFHAATYNSLIVDQVTNSWKVFAVNEFDEVQIMGNPLKKAFGIQFHPESFLSENLSSIRDQWITSSLPEQTN